MAAKKRAVIIGAGPAGLTAAYELVHKSDIEVLVVGNCYLEKEDQDPALRLNYKDAFELD